jgi:hypothetical protein
MVARRARDAGFTSHVIRAWLTDQLERNPPSSWGKTWRLVFDEDGRFGVITPEGFTSGDDLDMIPSAFPSEGSAHFAARGAPFSEPSSDSQSASVAAKGAAYEGMMGSQPGAPPPAELPTTQPDDIAHMVWLAAREIYALRHRGDVSISRKVELQKVRRELGIAEGETLSLRTYDEALHWLRDRKLI